MIVRPVVYSDCFEEEFAENATVSEDTVKKLIHNTNLLRALMPIGLLKAVHFNIPGSRIPPESIFQICDGAEITDPNSPLNGSSTQNTPDMEDRLVRGGSDDTELGNEAGGNATADLTHTHATGNYVSAGGNNILAEGDNHFSAWPSHHHGNLTNGLSTISLYPRHLKVAFFLKIN